MRNRQVVYVDYDTVLNRLLTAVDATQDPDTPSTGSANAETFRRHRRQLVESIESYLTPNGEGYSEPLMDALFEHFTSGVISDVFVSERPGRVVMANSQPFWLPLIVINIFSD